VASNEVSLVDVVGGLDGLVTETQVRNSNTAGLLGVVLEVSLYVLAGVVTDDLDGVFVCTDGAITAQTPTNPLSMYGIAKNALRQTLELLTKDKPIAFHWLRGYYIHGDDAKSNSVLGKILLAAQEGKEAFPFTSGKNLYDFISVEELAAQIAAASLQEKHTGIINCCSGQPISLGDMAESFIRSHNLNIRLDYGAFPDRAYDSPGVWGDATIIRQIMAECEG
jgi:dTDP-6-deoxy-L-talose 4-dehydrogenase (NAD+)